MAICRWNAALTRLPKEHIAHYTDASLRQNKLGLGIMNATQTSAFVYRHHDIHFGEMAAILYALRHTPYGAPVVIHTDSDAAIRCITQPNSAAKRRTTAHKYRAIQYEIVHVLRTHRLDLWLHNVKSHSGVRGNDLADALARRGTELKHGTHYELMENVTLRVINI